MKWASLLPLLLASTASADPIAMHVTDVAGKLAYVDAGADNALKPGMPVLLADKPIGTIIETNAKTAAIEITAQVAIGDSLSAQSEAPPPEPKLDDNTGQWPAPVLPASEDKPAAIPLAMMSTSRVQLAIIGHALGTAGQGNRRYEGELRAIGSFQLLAERPLGFDLDASARVYAKGFAGDRAFIARAATLRYGDPSSPDLMLGRIHYASTSLGILDGGRAALHFDNFEVAAFGGLVPDPITNHPDTTASRFGTEFVYDDPDGELRPRVAIGAHGSTWDGELDERRLNIVASMVAGGTWLDAWTEVQNFAPDNPFGASQVEVVGAGASVEWRRRDAHLGADLTYLVPERSLRILALIPEWVCTKVPNSGTPETCTGEDRLVASTASAGIRGDAWSVDGAASIAYTREAAKGVGGSGYLRGELRSGITGVHVTASGGRAGFADWVAGELGATIAPSKKFDAGLAYRPERLDEKSLDPIIVHSILADLRATIAPQLDLGLFTLASFGSGREVIAGLLTFAYRHE
jgi:hypothetical protein